MPSNSNFADARVETDAIVIGAGPVALFAAFECGHLGLKCHLVDSMPKAGGQCAELYPEKPIFDIPGIPSCTGQELVDGLLDQASPFKPTFHLDQQAIEIEKHSDGKWRVKTNIGTELVAPSVVIAAGVGSFDPRKLRIDGAEKLEGSSVFYSVRNIETFRDQRIVIAGGGDSALDWVLALHDVAAHITLTHRRKDFRAAPGTVAQVMSLIEAGAVEFHIGSPSALHETGGKLSGIEIKNKAEKVSVNCSSLLVFYGLSPNLGPIAEWGLNLDKNLIPVNTENFETQTPGVFAIGDICTYPGKLKLLLSGFHESALMAQQAFRYARPDEDLVFRHTTSNPEFQQRAANS